MLRKGVCLIWFLNLGRFIARWFMLCQHFWVYSMIIVYSVSDYFLCVMFVNNLYSFWYLWRFFLVRSCYGMVHMRGRVDRRHIPPSPPPQRRSLSCKIFIGKDNLQFLWVQSMHLWHSPIRVCHVCHWVTRYWLLTWQVHSHLLTIAQKFFLSQTASKESFLNKNHLCFYPNQTNRWQSILSPRF